jgi:hypothetical protein
MDFIKRLFLRIGFIAFIAGLVPTSVALFDMVTCQTTNARIEKVGINRFEISFTNESGQPITALVYPTQLGLDFKADSEHGFQYYYGDTAMVEGASVPILYRHADGTNEPRITHAFSLKSERIGIVASAFGFILLVIQAIL